MTHALVLLGLSIACVWLPSLRLRGGFVLSLWVPLFILAAVAAFASGMADARGMLAFGVLAGTSHLSQNASNPRLRRCAAVAAIAIAFLLAIGLVPGFRPWVGAQDIRLAPDASRMDLSLRFEPGVAGLFLLAVFSRRVASLGELRAILGRTLAMAAITTALVMALGVASGYVAWDPKLPWFSWVFIAKTLLLTAVMEEAFFRGVIQEGLGRPGWIAADARRRWIPVVVSTLLFGLAHARAGMLFVGLATLAGLGYSLAYALTRRVEAPIAVHFSVNTVHFVFFTYPHLATAQQ